MRQAQTADPLDTAMGILAAIPGVRVQQADVGLQGIRPRRDYDNDFVLEGLRLPNPAPGQRTLLVPSDALKAFSQARRAVHPEYLQILVRHAGRVWVFDCGQLLDVTADAQESDRAQGQSDRAQGQRGRGNNSSQGQATNPARRAGVFRRSSSAGSTPRPGTSPAQSARPLAQSARPLAQSARTLASAPRSNPASSPSNIRIEPDGIVLNIYQGKTPLGCVEMGTYGWYAYDSDGRPLGQMAHQDRAISAVVTGHAVADSVGRLLERAADRARR